MRDWHAEPSVLARYARGQVTDSVAFSVEAHLPACVLCRGALEAVVGETPRARVWSDVVAELDAPRRHPIERVLVRLGLPEHAARLILATPSLRLSSMLAVALAASFTVVASGAASRAGEHFVFLVAAPLVPLLAIATAFASPGPAAEVDRATPVSGLKLLLLRSVPVLVVALAAVAIASQVERFGEGTDARWLLPALSLSAGCLALSSLAPLPIVSSGLASAWLLAATASVRWRASGLVLEPEVFVAFRPAGQLAALAATVVFLLLLHLRSRTFDLRRI